MNDKKGIYKIIFIINEVFNFLSYIDLMNTGLTNKYFYNICKNYEFHISENYIKKLNRNLNYEKQIKHLIQKYFNEFPIYTLKIHMHNVLVDVGFNGAFVGNPQEIIIIMDFTYFYNNRYHRIKIYEDFSDEQSAKNEEELCKICYSVPGFNIALYEHIYKNEYEENYFKLLSKWMGFENIKNFDNLFYLFWGKYYEHYYDKKYDNDQYYCKYRRYKLFAGIYDDNYENDKIIVQKIDSTKDMNIYGLDILYKNNKKREIFKNKCNEWLNNLENNFNYIEELKIFDDIKINN
jgi:hypothetical protein